MSRRRIGTGGRVAVPRRRPRRATRPQRWPGQFAGCGCAAPLERRRTLAVGMRAALGAAGRRERSARHPGSGRLAPVEGVLPRPATQASHWSSSRNQRDHVFHGFFAPLSNCANYSRRHNCSIPRHCENWVSNSVASHRTAVNTPSSSLRNLEQAPPAEELTYLLRLPRLPAVSLACSHRDPSAPSIGLLSRYSAYSPWNRIRSRFFSEFDPINSTH